MFGQQEQQLKSPTSPPFAPDVRSNREDASFDRRR
jgi:hypothetical protein